MTLFSLSKIRQQEKLFSFFTIRPIQLRIIFNYVKLRKAFSELGSKMLKNPPCEKIIVYKKRSPLLSTSLFYVLEKFTIIPIFVALFFLLSNLYEM